MSSSNREVSVLDSHLNVVLVECSSTCPDFNILQWSKQIELTLYPIVSIMTRGLLSTIASASVISIEEQSVDDYRTRMDTIMV